MDLPIAIGILAGFIQGAVNTVRGSGEIYFESVTALIFFLLVGRFLQRRQQLKAAQLDRADVLAGAVDGPSGRGRRRARGAARGPGAGRRGRGPSRRLDPGRRSGRATARRPSTARCSPASRCPRRSRPATRCTRAPSISRRRLVVEVRSTGEDTRVGRLMRLVEEGAQRRAPVVLLADRISGWFVAIVLALALATVLIWWRLDPGQRGRSTRSPC